MNQGTLVAVNGKIYEYQHYDEKMGVHYVTEVEIDEDGILTATHIPCALSGEEFALSDDGTDHFANKQWHGIVEHFIRQEYDLTEEEITEATEDIVGRCFAYGIPKIHELADYIAEYLDR
jgi:hypothetical protein